MASSEHDKNRIKVTINPSDITSFFAKDIPQSIVREWIQLGKTRQNDQKTKDEIVEYIENFDIKLQNYFLKIDSSNEETKQFIYQKISEFESSLANNFEQKNTDHDAKIADEMENFREEINLKLDEIDQRVAKMLRIIINIINRHIVGTAQDIAHLRSLKNRSSLSSLDQYTLDMAKKEESDFIKMALENYPEAKIHPILNS